jgi:hypothetical protein
MTQGIQPFRGTLTSKRRGLENRSRPEGSGSARDGTVSELLTSQDSLWTQWEQESRNIAGSLSQQVALFCGIESDALLERWKLRYAKDPVNDANRRLHLRARPSRTPRLLTRGK